MSCTVVMNKPIISTTYDLIENSIYRVFGDSNKAMAVSSGGLHQEIESCIEEMERLKVAELKSVSRSIGLSLSGRKADLQDRLRAYLKNSCRVGFIDPWRPKSVLILIGKARQGDALPNYEAIWQSLKSGAFRHPVATGHQPVGTLGAPDSPVILNNIPTGPKKNMLALKFQESPFYRLKRMVNQSPKLAPRNTGRGVCTLKFSLNQHEAEILRRGSQFRLYLFCGLLGNLDARAEVPIQFPHPNEIRFNEVQVKDNVRGLKNKVGTAKPADLTPYLVHAGSENTLQLIYAFTKEDYMIYCYLVEVIPVEEILKTVLDHPKIVKLATLQYLKKSIGEDEDQDLVATSTVMTLQCPISYCRMKYPCKSLQCQHLQCFDAMSFILSQQQIPTWQCPVCQKVLKIEDLAICEFVDEVIKQCDEEVEQIEISSDGSWVPIVEQENPPPTQTSFKPKVKQEQSDHFEENKLEDETEDESAYKSRRSKSQQAEPVLISLDSDEEAQPKDVEVGDGSEPAEVATPSASNTGVSTVELNGRSDTLANIYGTYMDNDARRTLDPNRSNATPSSEQRLQTAHSPNEDPALGSAAFTSRHHQVPNVLGKTPLNQATPEFNQIGNQNSPSPHSGQTVIPMEGHEMSFPLLRQSSTGQSGAANEHTTDTMAGMRSNNNITANTAHANGLQRDVSRGGSSNWLALGHDSNLLSTADNEHLPADPQSNAPSASNSLNDESNIAAGQSSIEPRYNSLGPESVSSENTLSSSSHTTAHQPISTFMPPPMPPVPHGINRQLGMQSPVNGGNGTGRPKKPIVSPFIPKRPYMSMLPQKRHISGGNSDKAPTQPSSDVNRAPAASAIAPLLGGLSEGDLDYIDLTSDE
ncbi:LAMI_0D11078g1_1 [Lachancea mirantina]|uniref:LAMI_0D11078g1_1 n=1 Tax=Lachancea mirantina TaxID=1230905 RepID=A0A1G4JEQ7_9SACH|nr:LAMI_0D11078g1_1 [Lachancea mirantina]